MRVFALLTFARGWQVKDGALTVVDPEHAGDLASDEKFTWFDLSIEFNFERRYVPGGRGRQGHLAFRSGD